MLSNKAILVAKIYFAIGGKKNVEKHFISDSWLWNRTNIELETILNSYKQNDKN